MMASQSKIRQIQKDLLEKRAKTAIRAPGRARIDIIIAACIELIKECPPADISIAMIADKAGIKRTSIYSHFTKVDQILEQIAVRYLQEASLFVEDYVRSRRPRSLEDVVILMILAIREYFNTPDPGEDSLPHHLPFQSWKLVEDFNTFAALPYHALWDAGWDVEPLSEDDPFRTLVSLQMVLFEKSIVRHRQITDQCVEEATGMAVDFIRRVMASRGVGEDCARSPLQRIDAAAQKLRARGQIALLEASATQIEALVEIAQPA